MSLSVRPLREKFGALPLGLTALMAGVAAADTFTPLGFAHGMLYVPLLVWAGLYGGQTLLASAALMAVLFTGLGVWTSPPPPAGIGEPVAWANRILASVVILLTLWMMRRQSVLSRQVRAANEQMASQMQLIGIASAMGQLGGWAYDVDRNELQWTPEIRTIHGYPPDRQPTVAESVAHYAPEYRGLIGERFQRAVTLGEPFDEELQLVRVDGQRRWVRAVGRAVRAADGRVVRVEGAFQDIQRHRDVEQALADSGARWRRLAESMPLIVWTADQSGRLTYVSPALAAYAGVPEADLQREDWLQRVPVEDRAGLAQAWQQSLQGGTRLEAEYRLRRHDGALRWHLSRAVRLQEGEEQVWYGTTIDVDRERQLMLAERAAAARLHDTLESVTDAIFTLDRQWRFTFVNRHAAALLQFKPAELLGRSVWDVFPGAVGTRFQREYERCMMRSEVVRFEETFEPMARHFEVTAYPAQDGIAVYFRDLTEQRQLQEQLQQMRKLEALGQLTGGVAHDFNNLLTVISGNAELLSEASPAASVQQRWAEQIGAAAARGAEMTQRLLAFARRQPLAPREVALHTLVADLDPLLRRAVGADVQVDVVPGDGLWTTLVDPGQFESALLNLVVNARDAMPGGGRLTIATANMHLNAEDTASQPELQPGQYVRVTLSDTGQGMSPAVLAQAFDPFFTTKPQGKGTGLGLAMVYGFAKQSGGHAAIDSAPGRGTTVRLYLPRLQRPQHDALAPG